jgi:hypothetical protein
MTLEERRRRLEAAGCTVEDGAVTLPDGRRLEDGEAGAMAQAERALGFDVVQEASEESFPASDAPEFGGPGI